MVCRLTSQDSIFPLYFITDSRYTNEVSVYKLCLLAGRKMRAVRVFCTLPGTLSAMMETLEREELRE